MPRRISPKREVITTPFLNLLCGEVLPPPAHGFASIVGHTQLPQQRSMHLFSWCLGAFWPRQQGMKHLVKTEAIHEPIFPVHGEMGGHLGIGIGIGIGALLISGHRETGIGHQGPALVAKEHDGPVANGLH
ncbi:MAG: hypothetical protein WBG92_23710 [Thiohalocapsa sp.]